MKKVVKGSVIFNINGIIILFINIIVIYNLRKSLLVLLIFLLYANFLYWVLIQGKFHYFIYTEEDFVIKNSWNPFRSSRYRINEIQKIEIIDKTYMGNALKIVFKNGSIKKVVCNMSKRKLNEMVNDISPQLS